MVVQGFQHILDKEDRGPYHSSQREHFIPPKCRDNALVRQEAVTEEPSDPNPLRIRRIKSLWEMRQRRDLGPRFLADVGTTAQAQLIGV